MQKRARAGHKGIPLVALFIVSLFSLSLGLGLCLTKTPESKSSTYLALANKYQEQARLSSLQPETSQHLLNYARDMIHASIRITPYNSGAWQSLSLTLAQSQDIDRAMQARDIAGTLGFEPLPTIHAMRALLPARNLALSDPLDHQTMMR